MKEGFSQDFLETIQGPSRFLGGEAGSVVKDWEAAAGRMILLFPDDYDLGMSHLGFKIIYHAVNEQADLLCERAFCPTPDLEGRMRRQGLGLASLESGRHARDFDLIGLSLPHELAASNVLTLLDLAGLPLLAGERGGADPIVVAGGPAVFNPEPLADFLDAFFLGDGEEGAPELVRLVGQGRREGLARSEILRRLAQLKGVYVPAFYEPVYEAGRFAGLKVIGPGPKRVRRRIIPDLDEAFFPESSLVPFSRPVHDRLSIELGRGCSRGCRFCQAGMIYRPIRERSPQSVYDLALASLKKTGYDELSLLSLSAGDYSCLTPLLGVLMDRLAPDRVALSLPSLRADTLTAETTELIRQVRVTGLTIAPEAGSERLRAVINKNISAEQVLGAAKMAFTSGWRLIKLYFMIGLPTETEADQEAIAALAAQVAGLARGVKVNLSLSPFVPKPHTPFQWEPQVQPDALRNARSRIKARLKGDRGVRIKWNSPRLARLEGLLSRGDRRLSPVILAAWQKGARFEAWTEHFDWTPWQEAIDQAGLKADDYLAAIPLEAALPWDHLGVVDKDFLLAERARALTGQLSPDCRKEGCQGCGVCDQEEIKPVLAHGSPTARKKAHPPQAKPQRLAFTYHKLGPARFFGHLEMSNLFKRAFRRAGVRLGYSRGFHPQPRFSFLDALPVGAESLDEWATVEVIENRPLEAVMQAVNEALPEGLRLTSLAPWPDKLRGREALYRVSLEPPKPLDETLAQAFMAAEEIPYLRRRPSKTQALDLRGAVTRLELVLDGEVEVVISPSGQGPTPRPEEVVAQAFGLDPGPEGVRMRVLKLKTILEE